MEDAEGEGEGYDDEDQYEKDENGEWVYEEYEEEGHVAIGHHEHEHGHHEQATATHGREYAYVERSAFDEGDDIAQEHANEDHDGRRIHFSKASRRRAGAATAGDFVQTGMDRKYYVDEEQLAEQKVHSVGHHHSSESRIRTLLTDVDDAVQRKVAHVDR